MGLTIPQRLFNIYLSPQGPLFEKNHIYPELLIWRLSSNKKIFHVSIKMYIEALKNSGFKEGFTYLKSKKIKSNNNLYKD